MMSSKQPIRIEIQLDRTTLRRTVVAAAVFVLLVTGGMAIAIPVSFNDGQTLTAAHLNQNFAYLEQRVVPPGTIVAFGGEEIPEGWLLCDGTSLLRADYPALFAATGTAWGTASGSSFNLPDLRGRFLRGTDLGSGLDPDSASRTAAQVGGNTGDNVGTVQADEFKSHSHTYFASPYINVPHPSQWDPNFNGYWRTRDEVQTAPSGGQETRPKYSAVNFIIKS